ncbi:MAG: cytoplasmic protein [Mesorhizobium sp.]|nr:cytoplasmic protein [Mesorhizobium sp.]
MPRFSTQALEFRIRARQFEQDMRQAAAFFLVSGIDLPAALASDGEHRQRLTQRIARLVERERIKGARRHWSYDLNRHIALKQALDRLRSGETAPGDAPPAPWRAVELGLLP